MVVVLRFLGPNSFRRLLQIGTVLLPSDLCQTRLVIPNMPRHVKLLACLRKPDMLLPDHRARNPALKLIVNRCVRRVVLQVIAIGTLPLKDPLSLLPLPDFVKFVLVETQLLPHFELFLFFHTFQLLCL